MEPKANLQTRGLWPLLKAENFGVGFAEDYGWTGNDRWGYLGMDKLIIAVDLYKTDAEERHWLEALGAIQSDEHTFPNVVWLGKNIALLDHIQRGSIGPKLLAALRNQRLRYKLYGACDYPKELAVQLENCP